MPERDINDYPVDADHLLAILAAPLMSVEQREQVIRLAAAHDCPPLALLRYVHDRASDRMGAKA